MSFSDHTYGETISGSEEYVVQLIHRFLNEVGHDNSTNGADLNDSSQGCERNEFIKALEKMIQALHNSLREMRSESNQACSESAQDHETDDRLVPEVDPELIQVRADNEEIERRIAAFMERKQNEVDDINKREFCSSFGSQECEDSCARTDAVYIPTAGAASHVKVSRVVNRFGPQTYGRQMAPPRPPSRTDPGTSSADVEERVKNMEDHLRMNNVYSSGQSRPEIFERIKKLEERILTLESISPEYVSLMTSPTKKARREKSDMNSSQSQEMSLNEIDDRIATLRQKLKLKAYNVA